MTKELEKIKLISDDLMKMLRLKTYPVAINLFKKVEDIPEEYEKLEEDYAICHFVGMARYHEKPVYAISKFGSACAVGAKAVGFGEPPEGFAESGVGAFAGTIEAINKIPARLDPFPISEYEAIGFTPMNKITIKPDIIQVFGNPMQLIVLVYSNTWNGEPDITLSTNGHGASCYETLVIPYNQQKITLAIADMGDRRYGFASDDEMIMGIPVAKLDDLHKALIDTMDTKNRYPLKYYFYPMPK